MRGSCVDVEYDLARGYGLMSMSRGFQLLVKIARWLANMLLELQSRER